MDERGYIIGIHALQNFTNLPHDLLMEDWPIFHWNFGNQIYDEYQVFQNDDGNFLYLHNY